MTAPDKKEIRETRVLILIFLILAAGIILVGYFSYAAYAKRYRSEVGRQLFAIADLKAAELYDWRKERLGDANVLFRNDVFSRLVSRHLESPGDREVNRNLRSWLGKFQAYHQYDRIMLLDTRYAKRLVVPDKPERDNSFVSPSSSRILKSGKIAFEDFYWNEHNQQLYLKILVPIFEGNGSSRMIAVLAFRIDPNTYLYPFIKSWPTVSETAETLLVRREGNEVVFLNETKSQKEKALRLRLPLGRMNAPVVKAVLGREGIVEGLNYRDEPVIAALRTVPDSPWCLSVQMDISEINAPLRERGTLMIALIAALLIGVGASVGLVWRQQRLRFYREREEAAEALQASEEIYRRLVETANEAIYVAQDGMLKFVNRMTVEITGYSEQELTSTPFSKIIHPEDRDVSVGRHLRRIKGEAVPDRNQCRIITRDGSIKWAEISGVLIEWEGKPATLNVLTDITERKQAEERLLQSETRYRHLVESSNDWIWEVNQNGIYIYASPYVQEVLGYTPEEIIGKTPFDLMPEDEAERVRQTFLSITAQRQPFRGLENLNRHKDGHLVILETNGVPIIDNQGTFLGYRGMDRNITERKQAEEALRQSEENFRRSLDESPLGVRIVTMEGETLYANRAILDIYGYDSVEELINTPVKKRYTPESYLEFQTRREQRRNGFEDPSEYVVSIIRKDGSIRHLQVYRKEILWNDKRQYQVLYSDITERKRMELELRVASLYARSLIEASLDPLVTISADGKIMDVNKATEEITGVSREKLVGHDFSDYFTEPDRAREGYKEAFTQGFVRDYSLVIRHNSGRTTDVMYNASVYKSEAGDVLGVFAAARDITERKRAEEALRESEEQFRLLAEQSLMAIGIIQDGVFKYFNKAFEEINGYSADEIKRWKSLEFSKTIHPDDRNFVVDQIRKKQTGRPDVVPHYFFRIMRKNGDIRWIEIYSKTVTYKKKPADLVTLIDVTERKKAEEALRKSEERYRTLIETTRDLIYTTDRRGYITYMNPTLEKILGYTPHELNGKSFAEILAPDFVDKVRDHFRRAMKGELIPVYEVEMIRKDGGRIFLEFNVETLYDEKGKPAGRCGIGRDITERKRAEETLLIIKKAVESASDAIGISDHQGHHFYQNKSFTNLFEYTAEELEAAGGGQAAFSSSDTAREVFDTIMNGRSWSGETEMISKSGRRFPVFLRADTVKDDEGRIISVLGTFTDITDRKRTGDELKQSYQQLRALAERLQQIREESQIMIAQEIHDELGGGLTGLKMDLSWLSKQVENEKADKDHDSLMKKIHSSNKLIDSLIQNVRRIGTKLRPSILDDLGLIAALEWEGEEFAGRTGIQCEFVPAFEYVKMEETTATAVFRIFQEAMTNVARHSGADKVTVLFREEGGSLYLEVIDNGRGITEGEILNMKSLGILGMRERALVFGGELSISGEPGRGTTVVLKIPGGRKKSR